MRSRAVQPAAFLMLMCSISWHPEGGKKVAIAYSVLQFQQQPTDMSLSSYVWDVTNPNYPDLELVPASGAACPLLLLHASALLRDWRVTRLRSARVSRVQHQGSAPHSRRLLQRPFAVSLLPNAPFSSAHAVEMPPPLVVCRRCVTRHSAHFDSSRIEKW